MSYKFVIFKSKNGRCTSALFLEAVLLSDNVPNVASVCGGLWDNLKHFPDCIGISAPACWDRGSGKLQWEFNVGTSCNGGMVNSAWWEATRNQWGSVNCNETANHFKNIYP
ncbi:hypothetical protein DL98DRAFT_571118 [Cadophora sp. DSE1049]|nr:hypothetical protein DL98DRAFT_571118 [Cadophora sp. DSE1049]